MSTSCPTQNPSLSDLNMPRHLSSADMYAKYICICMCQDNMNTCKCAQDSHHTEVHEQHTVFRSLLISPEMPVKKCSSWFRGGSDIPECMWWTWICPGFPHIHSGVSAASSLDVGESYLKQRSIQWEEWSSNFFFSALDNPGVYPLFLKNRGIRRGNYIIWGAQYKMKM